MTTELPGLIDCDLIMKGGIASGVVYPPAIREIAKTCRFRGLGGASAGAIAAGLAAAAEYRRHQGGQDAFAIMDTVNKELGGERFIRSLFPPQPKLAPLYWALTSAVQAGPWAGRAGKLLRGLGRGWFGPGRGWGDGVGLGHLLSARSMFGCCTGMSEETGAGLVPWLHERYQQAAGLPLHRPLTFGDLEGQGVDLRMITTDVTGRRPIVLPIAARGDELPPDEQGAPPDLWSYKKEDFERLFPLQVCCALEARSSLLANQHGAPPPGHLWLKLDQDLPVVVAVRMSLSFPVLLTAVPLYRGEQVHWFSDGGISNNFPIQFYDSWLSSRPTVAINLIDWKPGASDVWRERSGGFYSGFGARKIEGLFDLILGIGLTAQSARDDLQSSLPGYQERVVQVYLTPDEGGLNLDMDAGTLENMRKKGTQAGKEAIAFVQPEEQAMHRRARLEALIERLAQEGGDVRQSLQDLGITGVLTAAQIEAELLKLLKGSSQAGGATWIAAIAASKPQPPIRGRLRVSPE